MRNINEYSPNRFSIIKVEYEDETLYKVFAGWSGGYTTGDSWRLSSDTVSVVPIEDKMYSLVQHSGSTYLVSKYAYGFNGMTASIYPSIKDKLDKVGGKVTLFDTFDQFLKEWEDNHADKNVET